MSTTLSNDTIRADSTTNTSLINKKIVGSDPFGEYPLRNILFGAEIELNCQLRNVFQILDRWYQSDR